jgi:hypothetical protein
MPEEKGLPSLTEVLTSDTFRNLPNTAEQEGGVDKKRFITALANKYPSYKSLQSFSGLSVEEQDSFISVISSKLGGIPDKAAAPLEQQGTLPSLPVGAETVIKEPPTFMEDIKGRYGQVAAQAPQLIGEISGDILGGLKFGAKTYVKGARAGIAGIGGAGGEAFKQIGEHLEVFPGDPPATSEEAAKRIGKAGLESAGFTYAGEKVVSGVQKVLRPFKISRQGRATEKYLRTMDVQEKRLFLLPDEATESYSLGIIRNLGEFGLTGAPFFSSATKTRANFLDAAAESFVERITEKELSEEALTRMYSKLGKKTFGKAVEPANGVYNIIKEIAAPKMQKVQIPEYVASEVLDAQGKPLMKQVMKEVEVPVGGAEINIRPIKEFVKDLSDANKKLLGFGKDVTGADMADEIMALDDTVSYDVAKYLKGIFRHKKEGLIPGKKTAATGLAKSLEGRTKKAIMEGLGEFDVARGTNLAELQTHADGIYATSIAKYRNAIVRTLNNRVIHNERPDKIIDAIFERGATTKIRTVKGLVGEKFWPFYERKWLKKIFKRSGEQEILAASDEAINFGDIIGKKLYANLYGPSGMGKQTVQEILGKEAAFELEQLTLAIMKTQTKQTTLGTMSIQLKQMGAVTHLATVAATGVTAGLPAAGLVLASPTIIAAMFLNKSGRRLLMEGITLPVGSPEAVKFVARFTREAAKYDLELKEQERKSSEQLSSKGTKQIVRPDVQRVSPAPIGLTAGVNNARR